MKNVELHIEKLPAGLKDGTELYLFMKHKKKSESNYDMRWAIGHRTRDDWWGVISLFPATNEKAIDRIKEEMELAKEAIRKLKEQLSSSLSEE